MGDITNVFEDIANSIRLKLGTQDTFKPTEMASAINNISSVGVFSGTSSPNSSLGDNGDIYLKYFDATSVILPTGFTLLAYIEALGNVDINTGVTPTLNTSVDLIGLIPLQGSRYGSFIAEGNVSGRVWGVRYTENGAGIQLCIGTDNDAIESNNIIIGNEYNIHAEVGKLIVNNTEYTGTTLPTFSDPMTTLRIFSNGYSEQSYAKLQRCKIYENGTLIRDFVPVKNNNNEIGTYDLVNSLFYIATNANGIELTDKAITDAYLKVNGAWQNLIGSSINDVN